MAMALAVLEPANEIAVICPCNGPLAIELVVLELAHVLSTIRIIPSTTAVMSPPALRTWRQGRLRRWVQRHQERKKEKSDFHGWSLKPTGRRRQIHGHEDLSA